MWGGGFILFSFVGSLSLLWFMWVGGGVECIFMGAFFL